MLGPMVRHYALGYGLPQSRFIAKVDELNKCGIYYRRYTLIWDIIMKRVSKKNFSGIDRPFWYILFFTCPFSFNVGHV